MWKRIKDHQRAVLGLLLVVIAAGASTMGACAVMYYTVASAPHQTRAERAERLRERRERLTTPTVAPTPGTTTAP